MKGGEGQGNLACYSSWGFKELELTEQLNDDEVTSDVFDSMLLWAIACQAALSIEFSRQEYWSGLPALLQGIFPS